ncbi:ATP-binding protein [Aliikangiella marina]|uniref:ATP-binding protein n=1 Tax=Aliikangiella marina TaxID=1712262 RepID=A0A545T571_9GAMM|nr:ATP-binding protein [Aliikangiella marina]TQV72353.1 ATP-binding protein [Aliikangiella marina]
MLKAQLILFCGKMGSGKSTKASEIAAEINAVMISEDDWLGTLYPNLITSLEDYVEYANRLKPVIKQLTQSMLLAGTNVVLDFPANTVKQRQWLKSIFTEINASHQLFFLDVSDATCLSQIEKRRDENPERASTDTPQMFLQVTKYFAEPEPEEGFNVKVIS